MLRAALAPASESFRRVLESEEIAALGDADAA
jgi:hypothetical protein